MYRNVNDKFVKEIKKIISNSDRTHHWTPCFCVFLFAAQKRVSILIGDQGISFNVLLQKRVQLKKQQAIKNGMPMKM